MGVGECEKDRVLNVSFDVVVAGEIVPVQLGFLDSWNKDRASVRF